ncbi:MAG: hypothetical protein AAGI66_10105 [Cyanobacteria bacterium P01_H01_bin.74]
MFDKILKTAHETGAEVMVQLKDFCYDQYKGRILEVSPDYFSLFHSGPGGGVHWAFKREDIAFIGLIVELPDPKQTILSPIDAMVEPLKFEQTQNKIDR